MLRQLALLLCQLERDGNLGRNVYRTAVARRRTETNLLRHAARFFIQPVSQSVNYALHHHLAWQEMSRSEPHRPGPSAASLRLVYCTGGFETLRLRWTAPARSHFGRLQPSSPRNPGRSHLAVSSPYCPFRLRPECRPKQPCRQFRRSSRTWCHCRCQSNPQRHAAQPPGPACRHKDCRSRRSWPAAWRWDSASRQKSRPGAPER